jgi:hypothetical protein
MEERKAGRGKIRSETVTVRLDQKLRYLAELGARKQRRTLSSYIEWAIEVSLERVVLDEGSGWGNSPTTSVSDVAAKLWDVEEADRFAKLAFQYPDLLTHHEQIAWKVLRENGWFWRGHYEDEWTWKADSQSLIWDRFRAQWLAINAVARGSAEKSELPQWQRKRPPEPEPTGPTDDEDIPF